MQDTGCNKLTLGLFYLIFCVGSGSNPPQANRNLLRDFSENRVNFSKLCQQQKYRDHQTHGVYYKYPSFYFLSFSF